MTKRLIAFIFLSFVVWRTVLFGIAAFSPTFLPTFGARFPYSDRVLERTHLPNWVWGFGNFDGVHYLRIAQDGYKAQYSQAFFPLYPIVIHAVASVLPKEQGLDTNLYVDSSYFTAGFFLTNVIFLFALFVFAKLLLMDFEESVVRRSIILLLAFPTAFYFGAIYTESLFFLLVVATILLMRKKYYLISGVLIALASATRVIGILLILVYLIELLKHRKWGNINAILGLVISPVGLVSYMYYLKTAFNDPLYFLNAQPIFGAERSSGLVLPLQSVFRYLKIFASVSPQTLAFFNAALEFSFFVIPLVVIVYLVRKLSPGRFTFSITSLLLPSFTGTLSSMPRYSLMAFFTLPFIAAIPKRIFWTLVIFFVTLTTILISLFIRGYWVS